MWILLVYGCGDPPASGNNRPPCEPICEGGPCARSLPDCPLIGCAHPGTPRALSNMRKRDMPEPLAPSVPIPFSALHRLQEAADALVPQGEFLTAEQWALLRDLDAGGVTVSEGDVVRLSGWIVGTFPAESEDEPNGESTNCCLRGTDQNDIHLPLIATAPEGNPRDDYLHYQSVVTEMIPQGRPAVWNADTFERLVDDKRQVMVVGRLFYDAHHHVHATPSDDPDGCGDPHRFTLWEVHPVRNLFVCDAPSGCSVDTWDGWTAVR